MKTTDDSWKIEAYVDGELELGSRLEIERRLEDDEALRRGVESLRALRDAVREKADRHQAPDALRERVAAMLAGPRSIPPPAPAPPRRASSTAQAWLADWLGWASWRPFVAWTALVAIAAVTLNVAWLQSTREERLMDGAVASHVRSTVGPHLVDVASSDRHAVKPFLSAKLGFSPPVGELPLAGSEFVGGRVDYFGDRPVAALVYRQGQHVVNSFVWPSVASDSKPEFASDRGYRIAHWSQAGMHHCVVSDLNREEFQRLVDAVREAAAG